MRVSMKMTLDRLIRALRSKMHMAADDVEAGYLTRHKSEAREQDFSTQGENNVLIRE